MENVRSKLGKPAVLKNKKSGKKGKEPARGKRRKSFRPKQNGRSYGKSTRFGTGYLKLIEGGPEHVAIRLIEDDFDRNVSQRPILIDVVAVDKVKQVPITGLNKDAEGQQKDGKTKEEKK